MGITIRPIEKQDETKWRKYWEAYNEFYKRTISEEVTATTFARFLDDKVEMYCAVAVMVADDEKNNNTTQNNEVVGFTTWFPHLSTSHVENVVYLNDLFVDPDVRSGGVGGKLIDYVYDHSRQAGVHSVYWHTQHFNHRAQLLYVKKATKSDFVHYSKIL